MSLSLCLMVTTKIPDGFYAHTMIEVEGLTGRLSAKLCKLPSVALQPGQIFNTFCATKNNNTTYGDSPTTPYGEPVEFVKAGAVHACFVEYWRECCKDIEILGIADYFSRQNPNRLIALWWH